MTTDHAVNEILLINGQIITMDADYSTEEALLVRNDQILAAGSTDQMKRMALPRARVIDLQGRAVLPGFIDTHVHMMHTGLNLLALDLSAARSIEEIKELLAERARSIPPGNLIRGIRVDDSMLLENRMPHRFDLDQVSRIHPIFLARIDGHSSSCNSLALNIMDIERNTQGLVLDSSGQPTGVLRSVAHKLGRLRISNLLNPDDKARGLRLACKKAAAKGLTTLHALEGGALFVDSDYYEVCDYSSQSQVRIITYFQTLDVEKAARAGASRIGGCIPLDGSLGSYTAALYEPYSDNLSEQGVLYYSDDEIKRFVYESSRAQMQISLHAIGERAIDQALLAYKNAAARVSGYHWSNRIEHFLLATDEQVKRAADLGLIISVQPYDHYIWGRPERLIGRRLGKRLPRANRYRTWTEKGLILAGSSDSDVTEFNPLGGIYGAMFQYNESERLSLKESLALYTINAAMAGNEQIVKGSLEKGKLADLVILTSAMQNAEQLENIDVELTMVGGRVVYGDLFKYEKVS